MGHFNYLKLFLIFIFAVSLRSAESQAESRCSGLFKADQNILDLNFSGGIVRDIYEALVFPKIRYQDARPIRTEEVQAILNDFWRYIQATHKLAEQLPPQEAAIARQMVRKFEKAVRGIEKGYSPFLPTSQILTSLILMSNMVKGHAFEMLFAIILLRSGFEDVRVGQNLGQFLYHNFGSSYKGDDISEIDVSARKDGQIYAFELKAIKSEDNEHMDRNLRKISTQVKRIARVFDDRSLRSKIQFVLVSHFDLGRPIIDSDITSYVDSVVSVRASYLDDIGLYLTNNNGAAAAN